MNSNKIIFINIALFFVFIFALLNIAYYGNKKLILSVISQAKYSIISEDLNRFSGLIDIDEIKKGNRFKTSIEINNEKCKKIINYVNEETSYYMVNASDILNILKGLIVQNDDYNDALFYQRDIDTFTTNLKAKNGIIFLTFKRQGIWSWKIIKIEGIDLQNLILKTPDDNIILKSLSELCYLIKEEKEINEQVNKSIQKNNNVKIKNNNEPFNRGCAIQKELIKRGINVDPILCD